MNNKEAYVGGIPENTFTSGFKGNIEGKSQATLKAYVTPTLITIEGGTSEFMAARIEGNKMGLLIVNGQGNPEKRHPDIYPAKLIKRSIDFFDEHGPSIDKIQAIWSKAKENISYKEHLDAIEQERAITEQDKLDAARDKTWPGKVTQSLGFTQIESLSEEERLVTVVFTKPDRSIKY